MALAVWVFFIRLSVKKIIGSEKLNLHNQLCCVIICILKLLLMCERLFPRLRKFDGVGVCVHMDETLRE